MQKNEFVINALRFISLVLVQVVLLNHIDFMGYVNPYLYILFILVFPYTGNRSLLIFLGFLLGLCIDIFADSGGIHAAASTFLAYMRPALLKFSFGVSYEYNTIKLSKSPLGARITYISTAVLMHHLMLFILEIFNAGHILLILKSTLFSGVFSILLIFCTVLIFSRSSS